MTFGWPRRRRPSPREAETHEQKTVVIDRKANSWPFGENTGLFGGSLMWVVEALAAAPPESCLYFQAFNDSFELPAGVQNTRSRQDGPIAVPRWTDDLIDFLLEQRTTFSPDAEVLELHPNPRLSAVPLDKNLTFKRAHRAFSGHFVWRPFVTDVVDDFCKKAGISKTETLGVHFRGTDKPGSAEAKQVEPELVIEAILDCLARRDHGFRFRSVFVATDEQPFADMLQDRLYKTLGASAQFCSLDDPTRVSDGVRVAIHHRKSFIPSRDCLFYAALNMLVLSRCALVLKSPSALSCFAKIMEPELPLRLVNGFTQEWFPDGAVPLYRAHRADLDKRLAIVQNRRNRFRSTVARAVKTLTSQKALHR
jgi:hypothetical protein